MVIAKVAATLDYTQLKKIMGCGYAGLYSVEEEVESA